MYKAYPGEGGGGPTDDSWLCCWTRIGSLHNELSWLANLWEMPGDC